MKKESKKKEIIDKIKQFQTDYGKCQDMAKKEYLRQRILDYIKTLKDLGYPKEQLELIRARISKINYYLKFYDYSLPENLREQIVIVSDSIRASPMHQKALELKNTAMIQMIENLEK